MRPTRALHDWGSGPKVWRDPVGLVLFVLSPDPAPVGKKEKPAQDVKGFTFVELGVNPSSVLVTCFAHCRQRMALDPAFCGASSRPWSDTAYHTILQNMPSKIPAQYWLFDRTVAVPASYIVPTFEYRILSLISVFVAFVTIIP
jgi:hypothetical protein